MGIFDYFKTVLVAQLFYTMAITLIVYSVSPVTSLSGAGLFTDNPGDGIVEVGADIDSSLNNQLGLPLVDLGSLVFFSGNIIADLILNFVTAVPGMINLLVSGYFIFFPIDAVLQNNLKLFITVLGGILYLIGVMAFLVGARSGREY